LKGVADKGERRDLVHSLLQQANLWDARAKSVGGYSGGMKQRLGIAIALAGRPKLLIVDEPTAGLDPTERHRFLNLLADIGDDVIVMLSTHIVEDVRELCRRMAIINGGEVILQGDPDVVLDELRGRIWRKRIPRAELDDLRARLSVISVRLVAGEPVINVVSDSAPGPGFTAVDPVLEDVYFHRVGSAALAE
jgi:ABC-type multidrug transport system ATPase subunit